MTNPAENDDRAVEMRVLDAAAWVLESERSETPAYVEVLAGLSHDEALAMVGHLIILCGYCLEKPDGVSSEEYLTRFIEIGRRQTYDLGFD